jgi:restriction system protein
MTVAEVPPYNELLWPALEAVSERGGSARIDEIVETVIRRQGFSEGQQAVLHNDGPGTEIGYRLAWARSYLKERRPRRHARQTRARLHRSRLPRPAQARTHSKRQHR